jgi:hypothetical protein
MHDLVDFLVEERYCNTESEAIKILESVSSEFYEYLIETSSDNRLAQLRKELNILMRGKLDLKDTSKIDKIKSLQKEIKELQAQTGISRITGDIQRGGPPKGRAPTPKGPSGGPQKPPTVISGRTTRGTYANVARGDTEKLTNVATKLTNISPGSGSKVSVRTGPESSELVTDLHTNPGASGARGTNVARSGGTRGVRRP